MEKAYKIKGDLSPIFQNNFVYLQINHTTLGEKTNVYNILVIDMVS